MYEFVWTINSASPEMPIDARFELAREAFVQLLDQERERGGNVNLKWPQGDGVRIGSTHHEEEGLPGGVLSLLCISAVR